MSDDTLDQKVLGAHGKKKRETKDDEHAWLPKILTFLDKLGMGPNSTMTMTLTWFVVLMTAVSIYTTSIAVVTDNWRLAAYFFYDMVVFAYQYIGSLMIVRSARESSPWGTIKESKQETAEMFGAILSENFTSGIIFIPIFLALVFIFANDECKRVGRPAPAWDYYFSVMIVFPIMFFTMVTSMCTSYDYMGKLIATRQAEFLERLPSLSMKEAMDEHRALNKRTKKISKSVSTFITILYIICMPEQILLLYDYFVMSYSHWVHLALYIHSSLMMGILMPQNWIPVNDGQTRLREFLAEGHYVPQALTETEGKKEGKKKDGMLEADEEMPPLEIWDAAQRAHFLIYLNNVVDEIKFLGWKPDNMFVFELCLFFASTFFLMWQITTLNGFQGFTFDRAGL